MRSVETTVQILGEVRKAMTFHEACENTGRRLADRFGEHRRDVINGRNDLPVPAHFNQENHTLEDL